MRAYFLLCFTIASIIGLLGVVSGQEQPGHPPTSASEAIRASGQWRESMQARADNAQRWDVDALRLADQQIRGRIVVTGSPLFGSANVEGQLSGRGVTGKLLDDEGQELAEFEGAVTATGAFGTYRDSAGRVGEWSWTGQLKPQER